jgi:hypothetical protein
MTRIPLVPMLIAAIATFFIIHYLFASCGSPKLRTPAK